VSSTPNTPAGWYPNPERAGQLRYWDGEAWTDHVHDEAPAAPAPEPQAPAAPQQFTPPSQPTGHETIAVPPGGLYGGDAPPQFGAPPSAQPSFGAPPQFGSPPPPGFGQPSYATGSAKPETPGFIGAFTDVFKNYANFSGRLSVGGYWRFFAMNIVVVVVLLALTAASELFGILYLLYVLVLLVPSLAAGVRRLHDTGKSGWLVLIALIPIVGSIILIVFLASGGDQQPNQYGPVPVKATA
jgi:uncharacterized membrane protein YhaH (DUF805 family)